MNQTFNAQCVAAMFKLRAERTAHNAFMPRYARIDDTSDDALFDLIKLECDVEIALRNVTPMQAMQTVLQRHATRPAMTLSPDEKQRHIAAVQSNNAMRPARASHLLYSGTGFVNKLA